MGTYKSAKGDSFQMIQDEKGEYACAILGQYQYVVIFDGFSNQEIHQVLDSTDLSAYK